MALRDCRMYEARYPEVDDVVMVQARLCSHPRSVPLPPARPLSRAQVKSIAEMGAYVSLLEYNNIEGMILLSELSRRRIRSVTKLIKVRTPAACARPRRRAAASAASRGAAARRLRGLAACAP